MLTDAGTAAPQLAHTEAPTYSLPYFILSFFAVGHTHPLLAPERSHGGCCPEWRRCAEQCTKDAREVRRGDGVASRRGQRGRNGRGETMEGRDEGPEGAGRGGEMMGHECRTRRDEGVSVVGAYFSQKGH